MYCKLLILELSYRQKLQFKKKPIYNALFQFGPTCLDCKAFLSKYNMLQFLILLSTCYRNMQLKCDAVLNKINLTTENYEENKRKGFSFISTDYPLPLTNFNRVFWRIMKYWHSTGDIGYHQMHGLTVCTGSKCMYIQIPLTGYTGLIPTGRWSSCYGCFILGNAACG